MSEMTGVRSQHVPQIVNEDDDIIVTIRLLFKGKGIFSFFMETKIIRTFFSLDDFSFQQCI